MDSLLKHVKKGCLARPANMAVADMWVLKPRCATLRPRPPCPRTLRTLAVFAGGVELLHLLWQARACVVRRDSRWCLRGVVQALRRLLTLTPACRCRPKKDNKRKQPGGKGVEEPRDAKSTFGEGQKNESGHDSLGVLVIDGVKAMKAPNWQLRMLWWAYYYNAGIESDPSPCPGVHTPLRRSAISTCKHRCLALLCELANTAASLCSANWQTTGT